MPDQYTAFNIYLFYCIANVSKRYPNIGVTRNESHVISTIMKASTLIETKLKIDNNLYIVFFEKSQGTWLSKKNIQY